MNDPRWRGWLIAIAIFILGVGVGGAGMAWAGVRVFRHVLQNPASSRGLADRAAERIGTDLTQKLQLTPDESAKVQAILAESAANLRNVRAQAATQATAELRTAVKRIADALPREKRADLYRIIGQRYKRLGLVAPPPDQTP